MKIILFATILLGGSLLADIPLDINRTTYRAVMNDTENRIYRYRNGHFIYDKTLSHLSDIHNNNPYRVDRQKGHIVATSGFDKKTIWHTITIVMTATNSPLSKPSYLTGKGSSPEKHASALPKIVSQRSFADA